MLFRSNDTATTEIYTSSHTLSLHDALPISVLLGLRRLGVVPHGNFGARGFASAIEVAARGVRDDVLGRTHERLAEAGALRSAPEPSAAAATLPDQS